MKKTPKRLKFSTPAIGSSIPETKLEGVKLKELFVCIWPQQINIKDRVDLIVVFAENDGIYTGQGLQLEFPQDISGKRILLFDKKADFLDAEEGFFLDLKKGGFLKTTAETGDLYTGDYAKEQRFKEMIQKLTSQSGDPENLVAYMLRNFHEPVTSRQSFAFAVYANVTFHLQDDCYFFHRNELPREDLPIYSMVAMVSRDGPQEHKPRVKKVWNPQWINDLGQESQPDIAETYDEKTFATMLQTTIDQFLIPMVTSRKSMSYLKDVLEREDLPCDEEALQEVTKTLLDFLLTAGEKK